MNLKSIKMSGSYVDRCKIRLANTRIVEWGDLSTEAPPKIPYGTKMEMTITYEECDYLSGEKWNCLGHL